MKHEDFKKSFLVVGLLLLTVLTGQMFGAGATTEPESDAVDTGELGTPIVSENGWRKPIPVSFVIDYTLVSDYIFRGMNFSDPKPGYGQNNEGRRWPNQQLTTGVEVSLGNFGRVGGVVWFEWYCGQSALTPYDSDKTLQQVNYFIYYGYRFAEIGLDAQVGYLWLDFRRSGIDTQEINLKLTWDDSILLRALGFDVKNPVLNPYLFVAFDVDFAASGVYYQLGMNHAFSLAAMGLSDVPFLKDVTITPSMSISGDHNYLNKLSGLRSNGGHNESQLDNIVYGLDVSYDLKNALGIPDQYCGKLYVKGFLNYSQPLPDARHLINDELWGGISIGYGW